MATGGNHLPSLKGRGENGSAELAPASWIAPVLWRFSAHAAEGSALKKPSRKRNIPAANHPNSKIFTFAQPLTAAGTPRFRHTRIKTAIEKCGHVESRPLYVDYLKGFPTGVR